MILSFLYGLLLVPIRWAVPWLARMFRLRGEFTKDIPDYKPQLADFLSLALFALTVIGVVMGWISVRQETGKENLETQIRDMTSSNADLAQRVRDAKAAAGGKTSSEAFDVHLQRPKQGQILVGDAPVEFQWQSPQHSDREDYLLDLIHLMDTDHPEIKFNTCDFKTNRSCIFRALNPVGQTASISWKLPQGTYLWRVVPVLKQANSMSGGKALDQEDINQSQLSDWSEFGEFEIYPDLAGSLGERPVIVGTTYSDSSNFSTIDENGRPKGHDVDLIHLLVESCMTLQGKKGDIQIAYDASLCAKGVEQYLNPKDGSPAFGETPCYRNPKREPNRLCVKLQAFPSVEDGLAAVRRQEIALFIGAVTRAKEREREGLRFTRGYYPFSVALYVHASERQDLEDWARRPQTVGVIGNTTDHWLATALHNESSFGSRLTIVPFTSYWALMNTFEAREVDGLLIDSAVGDELLKRQDPGGALHKKLVGLNRTNAWKQYYARLGYPTDDFAIAVASSEPSPAWSDRFHEVGHSVVRFFYLPSYAEPTKSDRDLYDPLQAALNSDAIQFALPTIRKNNNIIQPQDLP